MNELKINYNWSFEEAIEHLEALRSQYEEILASFSYYQIHDKVEFIRKTKMDFYSLHLKEWEINKLWEYMNGYEFLYVLRQMIARRKNE